ncbi:hypothetical protein HPP92_028759 [Vanilla planifolia]|uniref:GLTSCR protein conserved domain-containing protein n=2 Tax=Vanilla planifolia TaxID=51239 RepID=A0A835P801_VANPL|nr:hypothetical protein HPP92_028759 [Vanilla planifolia]
MEVDCPLISAALRQPRLLPYHVVADNEAEEDDEILNRNSTGEILAETDNQWDANIERKLAEFAAAFDKQVLAFNILSLKRNLGEFRSEERLMIEYALLQEERQAVLQLKEEMETREKAKLHTLTSNTQMLLAQAEQARVGMQCFRQASGNNSDVMTQELESAALWKHKETSEGCPSCEQEFYDIIGWRGPGSLDLNSR